jgi:hypothetical protein
MEEAMQPGMEETIQPGMVLKRAAATRSNAGNALTNNVMSAPARLLPSAIDSYRSQANDLSDRAFKIMDTPMDYSGLQKFAKQRGDQGDSAMMNAMAAQFAGEGFAPLQQQLLNKAADSRDPIKMSGGLITQDGSFVKDPEASQDKQVRMLLQRSAQLSRIAETAATAQERAAARVARNEINDYFKQQSIDMQRQSMGLRQDMYAARGGPGNFSLEGYSPDNKRVVTNSKSGQSFIMGATQDGTPSYEPYTGSVTPKGTYEKNIALAQTFTNKADSADSLIAKIEANPEAFGVGAAVISRLPGAIQGRVAAMALDDNTLKVRADVLRQAAMEISDIYGAAQSAGEAARATTFIPAAEDPPEIILEKLRAARDYARMNADAFGGSINETVRERSGSPQSNGDGELSSDEAAELDRLRAKHRSATP